MSHIVCVSIDPPPQQRSQRVRLGLVCLGVSLLLMSAGSVCVHSSAPWTHAATYSATQVVRLWNRLPYTNANKVAAARQPDPHAHPGQAAAQSQSQSPLASRPQPTAAPYPPASATTPRPAAAPAAAVLSCTLGNRQDLPAALDLSAYSEGVAVVNETTHYTLSGSASLPALRTAVENCSQQQSGLARGYHAATNYALNWQYQVVAGPAGLCRLVSAKVGVHIRQILPGGAISGSAAGAWETYITHVEIHEQGHAARTIETGHQLLAALQALPPLTCDQLRRQADVTAQSYAVMLASEHSMYDSQTRHGATQGATL